MSLKNKRITPVQIFPTLYDISDFVERDHPILYPESRNYENYWEGCLRKALDGKWGLDKKGDKGGYRWMAGNLWFYINALVIEMEDIEGGSDAIYLPPKLRAPEWFTFNAYNTCDGFSGHAHNEQQTSFLPVGKLQSGVKLKPVEEILLETYMKDLRKPNGDFKDYIEPREYLSQTHPEPFGPPLYQNECTDLLEVCSRGVGKSFRVGGLMVHKFVLHGYKTYADFDRDRKAKKVGSSTVILGAGIEDKATETARKFDIMYDHLRTNVGAYSDSNTFCPGYFWHPTTGSISSKSFLTNEKSNRSGGGKSGYGSKVGQVTYTVQNPQAGVGYRAIYQPIEEVGLLSNWNKVRGSNAASQKRKTKMGWTHGIGTGGNMVKIKEVRVAFNSPRSNGLLPFKNIFTPGATGEIGMFIPAYYRNDLFCDPQGNQILDKAIEQEYIEREEKLQDVTDTSAYDDHVQSYPVEIREVFVQSGTNKFRTDTLNERLAELEEGLFKKRARIGELEYVDPGTKDAVEFKPDLEGRLKPIIRVGDEDKMKDLTGAWIIYELPDLEKLPEASFHNNLHKVTYDPVNLEMEGASLACITVYKGIDSWSEEALKNTVVAERLFRMDMLEDMHEETFKAATLYRAKIMPEVMDEDIKRYARLTYRYHMLQPKPGLAIKGMIDQKKNYDVGVYLSPGIKPKAETLLKDHLDTVIDKESITMPSGYVVEKVLRRYANNLHSIRGCQELLEYRRDGNFDYVSCLLLLAIWLSQEDLEPVEAASKKKSAQKEQYKDYIKGLASHTAGDPAFNY